MSDIKLNVGAGYISAFYFVVLDLIALSLLDIVLARVVCSLYYRRINAGFPISIHSADIPGVTTYLIGKYYSRVNVVVYLLKFILFACLLYIDLGITNTQITTSSMLSRTGTFVFNASDTVWSPDNHLSVQRRWEQVRQCRVNKGESAQFYHIAFDLSHGVILDDELVTNNSRPMHELNDSTLECLSPEFVTDDYTSPGLSVIGCSQLEATSCLNGTTITQPFIFTNHSYHNELAGIHEGTQSYSYRLTHYEEVSKIFPGYATASTKSEMTCATTLVGVSSTRMWRQFSNCLLVVYNGSTTIFEKWHHDAERGILIRHFPGPVFNGTIEYGKFQRANQLRSLVTHMNWISFSSSIIADAVVYQRRKQAFERYKTQKEGTKISFPTVILAVILLIISIVARIIAYFTFSRDYRPQMNTIDGLSSIAREELQPSGRSYVSGENASLGWSYSGPQRIRFGPVRSPFECVKRFAGLEIE